MDRAEREYFRTSNAGLVTLAETDPAGVAAELAHRRTKPARELRAKLKQAGHWAPDAGRNLNGRKAERVRRAERTESDGADFGPGLVTVEGENRPFARTRDGLRGGYEHTGHRCVDAPCCGCCD